jgi:hypothetical protein
MSYMSSLEIKARNSYAIVALNNLRHNLEYQDEDVADRYKQVILDSIKLNEEKGFTPEYFSYSIQGLSNIDKSSAIQLSEALNHSALSQVEEEEKTSLLKKLKSYLIDHQIEDGDKAEIISLCKKAINYLSSSETRSGNMFIKYDI